MGAPWPTNLKDLIMKKPVHIHLHGATRDTLVSGKSPEAFSHNVKTEMEAGKPQKQALAIAYSKQRETADAPDDQKGHWITVNGVHIKVSEGGKITAGPAELKKALEHHHSQTKYHQGEAEKHEFSGEKAKAHAEAGRHHFFAHHHLAQAESTGSEHHGILAETSARKAAATEKRIAQHTPAAPKHVPPARPKHVLPQGARKETRGVVEQMVHGKWPNFTEKARSPAPAKTQKPAQGAVGNKPGWMLKSDPALAAKVKANQGRAKERQQPGSPSKPQSREKAAIEADMDRVASKIEEHEDRGLTVPKSLIDQRESLRKEYLAGVAEKKSDLKKADNERK